MGREFLKKRNHLKEKSRAVVHVRHMFKISGFEFSPNLKSKVLNLVSTPSIKGF